MAKLTELFYSIANAIRTVGGESAPIQALAFPSYILSLTPEEDPNKVIRELLNGTYSKSVYESTFSGTIKPYMFYSTNITGADFPQCKMIDICAFERCQSLHTVSFPVCQIIYTRAFGSCSALQAANFPACFSIYGEGFAYCTSLSVASFPMCTVIGQEAFRNCTSLQTITFPSCININFGAFYGCASLTSVDVGRCVNVRENAFWGCESLSKIVLSNCMFIENNAFHGCYNLLSLYLLTNEIATLSTIQAFEYTPISSYTTSTGGVHGSIIVPESLISQYKVSTNWSIYSDRFSAWTGFY